MELSSTVVQEIITLQASEIAHLRDRLHGVENENLRLLRDRYNPPLSSGASSSSLTRELREMINQAIPLLSTRTAIDTSAHEDLKWTLVRDILIKILSMLEDTSAENTHNMRNPLWTHSHQEIPRGNIFMSPKGSSVAQCERCSERRRDASSDLEPHAREALIEDLRRQIHAAQSEANSATSELVRVRGEAGIEREEAKEALAAANSNAIEQKAALSRQVEELLLELKIAKEDLHNAEVVWESERKMLYDRIKEGEKSNINQAEALALTREELDICQKELILIKEQNILSPLQRGESQVLCSDIIRSPTTIEEISCEHSFDKSAKDHTHLPSAEAEMDPYEPQECGSPNNETIDGIVAGADSLLGEQQPNQTSEQRSSHQDWVEGQEVLMYRTSCSRSKEELGSLKRSLQLMQYNLCKVQAHSIVWIECPNTGFIIKGTHYLDKQGSLSAYGMQKLQKVTNKSQVELIVGNGSKYYYAGTYTVRSSENLSVKEFEDLPTKVQQALLTETAASLRQSEMRESYLTGNAIASKFTIRRLGFDAGFLRMWESL